MEATRGALRAGAACGDDAEADVVPGLDVGHCRAHGFDDAGAFVAHHHRPATRAELAVGESHVGVADAGRGNANEHLACCRRRELDLLDDEWLPRFVEDGCANSHQPTL